MSKENLCNIFELHGIKNESQVKIKHVNNVLLKENERINDTKIKKFEISPDIVGEISQCSITNTHLQMTKKLPILYMNVTYEQKFRVYLLFRIYLFFTVTSDIKSANQLLSENIDGSFSLEISLDGTQKTLDNLIPKYPGNEKIYAKLMDFALTTEMKDLAKSLVNDINEKLSEQYKKDFESFKPPTKIISLRNYKVD
jgi:hypothetical protein